MAPAAFSMPPVYSRPDGWGPSSNMEDESLSMLSFSIDHLDKFPISRIGRICDFTVSGQRFAEQRAAKGKGKGKTGQALAPGKDDEGFALVDNRPMAGKSSGKGRGKSKGKGKGIAVNYQEGILGQKQKQYFQSDQQGGKGKTKGKSKKGGFPRRGVPSFKEWSVQTKTEWEVKRELKLSEMAKLQINSSEVTREDVVWCGQIREYNKEYDRITVRTKKPMTRFEELNFFNVTTSDDPMLPDLLQSDASATVIATDHVLAALVSAARSVYSWDIVITKIQDKLIFDKRDGSQIDYLTVNETSDCPPNNDDPNHINSPLKLGQETSCINQNFSQMVLDTHSAPVEMEQPNPFEEEGEGGTAASVAYRYQKITLPGNSKADSEFDKNPVSLIVRTEVNAKMPETGQFVSVKALSEYDPKPTDAWATHLETQRGKVLATELKNNAFKLGRWTAQAILAGCSVMKIGYVTRVASSDPWSHSILGVQTNYTDQFAEQIGMTGNNVFGILRNIIDLVMSWEDGKYLILKDPTKAIMRIYEVPWDALGGEGEEDEDAEDEGPALDLDEDGNVVPTRE